MHYAKVNPADFGGIVVDETHGFCVKFALNRKFFAYFALNCTLKKCLLQTERKKRMILIFVNVAANTD